MRISVYCADQTAYHSEKVLEELYNVYPYMKGYHINDVYKAMCDCWNVPPIKPSTKEPYYSDKPALLADGEMDNACRPLYIDMIHQYMPTVSGCYLPIGRIWQAAVYWNLLSMNSWNILTPPLK